MAEDKKKSLPENVIGILACNANIQIGNNVKYIIMPIYVDRTAQVNQPRASITYKLPKGAEVEVVVEIPFKGNVTDPKISLDDAMEIMKNAGYTVNELHGKDVTIENDSIDGNQIKIVGHFTVDR